METQNLKLKISKTVGNKPYKRVSYCFPTSEDANFFNNGNACFTVERNFTGAVIDGQFIPGENLENGPFNSIKDAEDYANLANMLPWKKEYIQKPLPGSQFYKKANR